MPDARQSPQICKPTRSIVPVQTVWHYSRPVTFFYNPLSFPHPSERIGEQPMFSAPLRTNKATPQTAGRCRAILFVHVWNWESRTILSWCHSYYHEGASKKSDSVIIYQTIYVGNYSNITRRTYHSRTSSPPKRFPAVKCDRVSFYQVVFARAQSDKLPRRWPGNSNAWWWPRSSARDFHQGEFICLYCFSVPKWNRIFLS